MYGDGKTRIIGGTAVSLHMDLHDIWHGANMLVACAEEMYVIPRFSLESDVI